MLMALALYPVERTLFFLRKIRGFRRADHVLTNKILRNHRVIFSCRIYEKRLLLFSNPSDDLFGLLRERKIGSWEPGSLQTWQEICSRSRTVVDVGAYSGIYSLLAAKMGVSNILSVEPNPFSARRLKMNKFINRASRIRILNQPLSYVSNEELGLYVPQSDSPINRSRYESSGARFVKSDLQEIQIDDQLWTRIDIAKTIKLDDLMSQVQSYQEIDGIKIDAEGMELSILKGAHLILSQHRPELIIETWSDDSTHELNDFLRDYGYEPGIKINDANYNVAASNLYFRVDNSKEYQ